MEMTSTEFDAHVERQIAVDAALVKGCRHQNALTKSLLNTVSNPVCLRGMRGEGTCRSGVPTSIRKRLSRKHCLALPTLRAAPCL